MRVIATAKAALKRLLGRSDRTSPRSLYTEKEYLEAYALHSDLRVEQNPKDAIGGLWEELGRLQFDFLLGEGLKPSDRMLDIGCGTLRGGRHFIRYLDRGGYTGIDISQGVLRAAGELLEHEGLVDRSPRLIWNERRTLTFEDFEGERFDVLLAQSVFTHLPTQYIEECFANVGRVMAPGAAFYFTFKPGERHQQTTEKDFQQPPSFYEALASRHGFLLEDRADRYPHPRGQRMMRVTEAPR